jgi:HTH-type transcriptional regulator/antitoxin HigA
MFEPKFAYHPWEYLDDELKARNWTQRQFADIIWIPAPELNAIIKWRKNLTPALCVRIGEAFWTSADLWMNMQTWYSLSIAREEEEARIKRVHEKLKEYCLEWQFAFA